MTKSKVAIPKAKPVTEEDLDKEISALEATSVKEEAEKTLKKRQLDILKRVSYYVARVGLDIKEACILLGVDPDKFYEEMEIHPIIRKVLDMKELEYKKDMMATLSARARGGDDKIAQWLLETKDPDKYGKKKGPSGDGASDLMAEAYEFVQTSNNGGLIKETSGEAVTVKQTGEKKLSTEELLKKINKIGS